MTNFKIINTKYDKQSLHYFLENEKCLYSVNKDRGNIKYLSCIHKSCKCNAKFNGILMTRTNNFNHNHPSHETQAEFEDAYEKLKFQVDSSSVPIQFLHRAVLRSLSREAAGMLCWKNVHSTLQRIRRQKMPPCRNLKEFDDLLNMNDYVIKTYGMIRNKNFYQGSVDGQIVFAHPELIPNLSEDFEFFVDATFKVVPLQAYQLLIIMATLLKRPRPIIYIIMNKKNERMYQKVFKFVRDAVLPANGCFYTPKAATMDYEMGLRNAVKKTWPKIQTFGCNFHFCKAIFQNAILNKSLSKRVLKNSSKHNECLLMFMRLSLLPLRDVEAGIELLLQYIQDDPVLKADFKPFIKYFNTTWTVRYKIEDWCVSDRRYRTNNVLEGYNAKVKQYIQLNPSAYAFLQGLLDLAYDADSDYENAKRKSYIYNDVDKSNLTPLLNDLLPKLKDGSLSILDFLKSLSKKGSVTDYEEEDDDTDED